MHSAELGCKELPGQARSTSPLLGRHAKQAASLRSKHPFRSSGCGGKCVPCLCSCQADMDKGSRELWQRAQRERCDWGGSQR